MQDCYLVQWLEEHIGFETYQHLGSRSLERIRDFFQDYKDIIKKNNVKIITVAGTNGKGQTSYSIASLLTYFHQPFGLFISPHVHSITERFQSHLGEINKEKLFKIFQKIQHRQLQKNIQLSFFEFLFAAFLEMTIEDQLPQIILEVGVGGRLDATNLLDASVAIITSIGRDHQDLLGNRLDLILYEKLGILRKNQLVFSSLQSEYVRKLALDFSKNCKANHKDVSNYVKDHYGPFFDYSNRYLALSATKAMLPFLDWKNFDEKKFIMQQSHLPGRGEVYVHEQNQHFHLYGSHNLDGMRAWLRADLLIRADVEYDYVLLAFSKRTFKDIKNLIKFWKWAHLKFRDKYKTLILTSFDYFKAFKPNQMELEEIAELVAQNNQTIKWLSNWKDYNRFLRIKTKNTILIIGSFYFVSEVKKDFQKTIS